MKNEKYFVYCDGILGVKTNMPDFKWVYGQVAPETTQNEYDKCVVKFEINIKKEKKLHNIAEYDSKFQSYYWNDADKILSCRRSLLGKIRIGYNVKFESNRVIVEMGRNYHTFVKKRFMNLHDTYYLLSDLANVLLIQKGYDLPSTKSPEALLRVFGLFGVSCIFVVLFCRSAFFCLLEVEINAFIVKADGTKQLSRHVPR